MFKGALRLLTAALVVAGAVSVAHAQPIELKVSHYLPPNHTLQKVLEAWGEQLDQKSGGRLKLRIYPASQLGPVQRQFDLARNGQADLAIGLTGATPGRYPMTEIAGLPFVHPAEGTTSAIMSKRLTELAPKYLAGEYGGLHILWVGATPQTTVYTARREIKSIDDLHGLKIRSQGEQHAKVLRELGATPLQVPPGDMADGMSKGVIDGALFNFEGAESFGLGTVTRHIMEPTFLTATLVLVMNSARYDALPPDLRAIIDQTTGPAAAEQLGIRWDQADEHGREYMIGDKVALDVLPPAELDRLKATLQPLVTQSVDTLDKTGKPARQFLADYSK